MRVAYPATTHSRSNAVSSGDIRREAHRQTLAFGGYVPSPYPAWSPGDMAWLAGIDDASGSYPDGQDAPAATIRSAEEPQHTPMTTEQLTLF